MPAKSTIAILLVVVISISSVMLIQNVEGASHVHVGVIGAPVQVGVPFVISFYTDLGYDGMATVFVRPALGVTPIWEATTMSISGGLDYEVNAPGINTPGGYFASVSFLKTGGGSAELGEKLFQVIGPASVSTDWAIQSVSLTPPTPQVGDPVTFNAVLVALSTSGAYPQSVDVECTIDGASCGGGALSYPGPTGNPATVSTQTPWIASPGTHTLTWSVSTNNDPNPSNNVMSTTFNVGPAVQTTTQPVAQFDFSLSASPTQQSATPGGSASYTVTVNPVAGPQQSVALSVSGLPTGVSASFNPTSGTPPFTSTLSVTVASSVSPGTFMLTIVGSGGGVTHTASVTLTVSAAADFAISVSPPSQSVLQGQTISYSVNVDALNGFNSQVTLSVSGLPSGANGVFSNPSGTPNFVSTLTVTLPSDVATASYTLTVTGSGGGLTHVANLVLTVNAAATTQTSTSSAQTSSDLMSMIQQNQLLILGGIVLLAAVIIAAALLSRRKSTPNQATKTGVTTGMVFCGKCGTQNPSANDFCAKCGTKLH